METQAYYLKKISDILTERKRSNPRYSLRAYARDLGVHPSTLSQILKGSRSLPIKDSLMVAAKLDLAEKEKALFLESLLQKKSNLDEISISEPPRQFMLDESYYKVIAEWEHYAALELFELKNFKFNLDSVRKKLDLSEGRAKEVIENLLNAELIVQKASGQFGRVHDHINTTEDVPSRALRASHKEALEMGKEKIESIPVELRDFSSQTLAVDLKKIPQAKAIIREFRKKMAALMKNGEKTEIFQMSIQFFPLTKILKVNSQE